MGLSFDTFRPEDVADTASALARRLGRAPERVAAWLHHVATANPFGYAGIVVRHPGTGVVAHMGASVIPVCVSGNDLRLGRLVATFTDPDFRMGGWHGLPHELDAAFEERFGDDESFKTTMATFSEEDFWSMRRFADHEALRTPIDLVRAPAPPPRDDGAAGELVPVDAAFLDTWTEPLRTSDTCTLRDGALMRFRLSGPWSGDRGIVVVRDGTVRASAILRDVEGERRVLDFACDADEACLRRLVGGVIGDGMRSVTVPLFGRSSALLTLQRAGFRAVVGRELMVSVRSSRPRVSGAVLAERWELCASDTGLHPLLPILPPENPCVAAPPGTRAGSDKHA